MVTEQLKVLRNAKIFVGYIIFVLILNDKIMIFLRKSNIEC